MKYNVNNKGLFIGFNNVTLFSYLSHDSQLATLFNKELFDLDHVGGYVQINSNYKLPKAHTNVHLTLFSQCFFFSTLYLPLKYKV